MRQRKIKSILFIIFPLLTVFFGSCSGYNKIVKGDNYELKFETANQLFEKGQFFRSIALYEQIYQKMPKTGEGELAYYRMAKAYFSEKDYVMAGYYFGSFVQRYPYSSKTEESLFLSALCSVYNSPEISLDQNDTELAIKNLQQFVDAYPQSELLDSCNRVMDNLRFKLERKEYDALKLYVKTENYRAAVTSAETFLTTYPRSRYREEVSFLQLENSFLVAKNSVENKKKERIEKTIERYRTFVSEYPESSYKNVADKISDNMYEALQRIELNK